MADDRAYFHTLLRGLVLRHYPGKQNCAAREIAEYWAGHELHDREVDYGGFSRKMNGSREWTFYDVLALASITGSQRVWDAVRERERQFAPPTESRTSLVAKAAKESGEGVEHALSEGDLHQAFSEADDAERAWSAVKADIKAEIDSASLGSQIRQVS